MDGSRSALSFFFVVSVMLTGALCHSEEPRVRNSGGRRAPDFAVEIAKLTASDPGYDDWFGHPAVTEDLVMIGAHRNDNAGGTDAGAVYVFEKSGDTWTEVQKITASDGAAGDWFGGFIALAGDTAFIVAGGADHSGKTDAGAVYIFTRSGGLWVEHDKLVASDADNGDEFGWWPVVLGDTLVVGAPAAGAADQGQVYVFIRSGDSWIEHQIVTASDGVSGDRFGQDIALSDDTLAVGALHDDHAMGTNAGSVYIFEQVGGSWTETQRLTASDGQPFDEFGYMLDISNDVLMVGAAKTDHSDATDAGSVYVFTRVGGVWSETQKLAITNPEDSDQWGWPLLVSGDHAFISAAFDDHSGLTDAGSVFVFYRSGSTWFEYQQVVASDASSLDFFGWDLSLFGDMLGVSATRDGHSGQAHTGSAYLFRLPLFLDDFESGDTSAWSAVVP